VKTCANCDADISTKPKRAKFCDLSCWAKFQNQQRTEAAAAARANKTCKNCQVDISRKPKAAQFCSHSCAARFNNLGNRKHGQAPNDCLNCGGSTGSSRQQYCSSKCHTDHAWSMTVTCIESDECVRAKVLKKYLLQKHGMICLSPTCAWDFQKRPIMVEIEHKDGNFTNSRLSNCTLLCPNCHSETPTYRAKNTGKGRWYRRNRYRQGLSH
jgi:hypothetical protein